MKTICFEFAAERKISNPRKIKHVETNMGDDNGMLKKMNEKVVAVIVALMVNAFGQAYAAGVPWASGTSTLVSDLTTWLKGLIITATVCVFIWHAVMWVVNSHDQQAVEGAKKKMKQAGVGVVLALLATGIVTYLQSVFT